MLTVRHSDGPPPEILYHYADASAFLGMIRDRVYPDRYRKWGDEVFAQSLCMFGTDLRYMNDHAELREAGHVFARVLRAKAVGSQSLCVALADDLESNDYLPGSALACAVSFTAEADSLSQWRAYAGGTGGFAIGVPFEVVERRMFPMLDVDGLFRSYPGGPLVEVSYDPADIAPAAEKFADRLVQEDSGSPNAWTSLGSNWPDSSRSSRVLDSRRSVSGGRPARLHHLQMRTICGTASSEWGDSD